MKQFDVVVYPKSIEVQERSRPLMMYEISATVDGETYRYHVVKIAGQKMPNEWRERGNQQAFYHAKNAGENVNFHEVHYVKPKRKKNIHANQLELF